MKKFSELTNYEKINVSTKDVGLTEEQIFELHIAGVDKIDLILAAEDQMLAEITDIDFDITKDIKIALNQNSVAIDIPINETEEDDEYTLEKPYALLQAITQAEIFDRLKSYKEKTGTDLVTDNIENLYLEEELRTMLAVIDQEKERILLAAFPARIVATTFELLHGQKMDMRLIIEFRKYVCSVTGMSMRVYDQLDEYAHKASVFEKIERENI